MDEKKKILLVLTFFYANNSQPITLDTSFGVNGTVSFAPNQEIIQAEEMDGRIICLVRTTYDRASDTKEKANPIAQQDWPQLKEQQESKLGAFDLTLVKPRDAFKPMKFVAFKNGVLDKTFGGSSSGESIIEYEVTPFFLLTKNRSIIFYSVTYSSAQNCYYHQINKLTPDGLPDPSFGIGGKMMLFRTSNLPGIPFSHNFCPIQMVEDTQGRLLLLTRISNTLQIARISSDGKAVDTTFGTNGKILIEGAAAGLLDESDPQKLLDLGCIATLPNGNIVVRKGPYTIGCYNDIGLEDKTFGIQGAVTFKTPTITPIRMFKLKTTSEGKILIGFRNNYSYQVDTSHELGSITRLNQNGTIDKSFGDNGWRHFIKMGHLTFTPLNDGSLVVFCIDLSREREDMHTGLLIPIDASGTGLNKTIINIKYDGDHGIIRIKPCSNSDGVIMTFGHNIARYSLSEEERIKLDIVKLAIEKEKNLRDDEIAAIETLVTLEKIIENDAKKAFEEPSAADQEAPKSKRRRDE